MAFSWDDVGRNKAKHMELVGKRFGSEIIGIPDYFINQEPLTPILVFAVDSILARKSIWEVVKDQYDLFIDMRTGYASSIVYSWKRGEDSQKWRDTLETEEAEVPCGAKAVAHNCLIPVAIAAGVITNYSNNIPVTLNYYEFDLNTMLGNKHVEIAGEVFT